jgi:hypothetical protein
LENINISTMILALVAALGVLGLVMVLVANNLALQEVEAGCERGAAGSHAFNQSKGKCLGKGLP